MYIWQCPCQPGCSNVILGVVRPHMTEVPADIASKAGEDTDAMAFCMKMPLSSLSGMVLAVTRKIMESSGPGGNTEVLRGTVPVRISTSSTRDICGEFDVAVETLRGQLMDLDADDMGIATVSLSPTPDGPPESLLVFATDPAHARELAAMIEKLKGPPR